MGSQQTVSWLDKLEEWLDVDVDWMDPEFLKEMSPFTFHDQTSNQLWVDNQLGLETNRSLFIKVAKELKNEGWLAIYTRMAVELCKKNINSIRGRVLLQTLPSQAYNTHATLEHAHLYDREFARAGIPRERYCIKIPSTGPALNAAKILSKEGIPTLGTALFCLPQAIACSQADVLYISPYFNETRAHSDRTCWPECRDPATQHPNSPLILQILHTYRRRYAETGKDQPLVKNASFISVEEAMAAGEMGCHSATISHTLLAQLAQLPYESSKQPGEGRPKPTYARRYEGGIPHRLHKMLDVIDLQASTEFDYLDKNGRELDRAIEEDAVSRDRLRDALVLFVAGEERSRAKVEAICEQI